MSRVARMHSTARKFEFPTVGHTHTPSSQAAVRPVMLVGRKTKKKIATPSAEFHPAHPSLPDYPCGRSAAGSVCVKTCIESLGLQPSAQCSSCSHSSVFSTVTWVRAPGHEVTRRAQDCSRPLLQTVVEILGGQKTPQSLCRWARSCCCLVAFKGHKSRAQGSPPME